LELNRRKNMEWIEIKTMEDIEELHRQYNFFEDSYVVKFSFDSGNYVDREGVGHEYNNNNLILVFERLDDNPFSIEIMFTHTRRLNYFFPVQGKDNWTSDINFAKIVKNDEFYYWTIWKEFDPYNDEHLEYNDFILIEAKCIKWRVIE